MNFIEKNTKKVALFLCLATAGSAVTTVYAASNSTGWNNGVYIKEDGKVATGWLVTEDGTYFCNEDGSPLTGWQEIEGETYFFSAEGMKVAGEQIIDGHKYIFTEKGNLMTGWDAEHVSYYNAYGEKTTGLQKIEDKTYLFNDEGAILTGWQTVEDKSYYFNTDGAMATSQTDIEGATYYFNEDGRLTTGWQEKDGEKFYYDEFGKMTTGWKSIDGNEYYFTKAGEMLENTEYADYKFDENGVATPIEEEVTNTATTRGTSSESKAASYAVANGGIANSALSQVGAYQDCTALASNALAANGIYFHGWPADYLSLGSVTSTPQPGDLIYYANGGMGMAHIAVYVGNGQAVHGGWNGNQTVISSAYVGSGPVYIHVGN